MKKMLLVLLLFLCAATAGAQRVGLVFSGGGAKGLYHVGILKALEENNIPVDYIAGTSMGAIIGGLYAVGYTPEEMETLFLSEQVRLWMTGRIESRYNYYYKRMDQLPSMVSLPIDFRAQTGLSLLPRNLIPSNQIDMSFIETFGPASAGSGGDFDNLFVPFRCIAADVYNKREVVFRGGDLGRAIRASMTIPLVFKPTQLDSLPLYDGGIYNNFPWQVVEEDFSPDVLIGGKCIRGAPRPDDDNPFRDFEAITMERTDFNMPEDKGILIERVFDDVTVLDFSKARMIIDRGYEDAMAHMDEIKARITRRVSDEELYNRRLAYRSQLPVLIFDDYRVTGLDPDQTDYVQRLLGLDDRREERFTFERFKSDYFKLLSEGDFVGDFPTLSYNDTTGCFAIDVRMATKPSFKVSFGGNISSTSHNQAYLGLEYKDVGRRAHTYRFDGMFSALYMGLAAGLRNDFFHQSPLFSEFSIHYNRYNYLKGSGQTEFNKNGYTDYNDTYASYAFGFPTGRSSVLQFRGHLGRDQYFYYENPDFNLDQQHDRSRFDFYGVQAEASRSTLNFPLYPTRGTYQSGSAVFVDGTESFFAGESYPEPGLETTGRRTWFGARFLREEYFPVAKWFSFGYYVDAVVSNHPDFETVHATQYTAPAFTPTSHSKTLFIPQFRSPSYVGGGVMPTFEFTENFYLKTSAYIFIPDDYLYPKDERTNRVRYIATGSLVYQTPIGPASLSVTKYDVSSSWFVEFNFGYLLFNRKGLFY